MEIVSNWAKILKTVVQNCFAKKVVLKITQYSQKKPVLEPLFNKVAGLQPCNLTKKDSNTGAFL